MLRVVVLVTILSTLVSTLAVVPVSALPASTQLISKKPPKKVDVLVTEAKIENEAIAGSWFYSLTGKVANKSEDVVRNVLVHYEIYSETTGKLVDAGSVLAEPVIIPSGGESNFSLAPNTAGKVKVTLISWQKIDGSHQSYSQMQLFP